MTQRVVAFEMTDDVMRRAVRENCVAAAREQVKPRDLLLVLASTAVFVAAIRSPDAHWIWWIAGVPAALLFVMAVGWVVAYLWLPGAAVKRLAHLPHRKVRMEVSDQRLAFETATERLELAWSELKTLKRRPSFWVVSLQSGTRIPVPVAALDAEVVGLLEGKLQ